MRKLTLLLFTFAFFLSLASLAHGQAQPFGCSASVGVPLVVRAEGLAELVGDLTLTCTGGTPTPAGQSIPEFGFTVLLNTNITSKLTAAGQTARFTEALLLIDEPASAVNPGRPILNCGNDGASDLGLGGPGICPVTSTGNPAMNYDGTPNGYPGGICDGAGGRPAPDSPGCGRPNVFQGQLGTAPNPTQLNAITFLYVPVDPPGPGLTRTLRITNIRVNAASLPPSSNQVVPTVQATISTVGSIPLTLSNPQQAVAFVEPGLISDTTSCSVPAPRLCMRETFASGWRPKNISFAVGNGISGNASPASGLATYWTYNGGTNYPTDVAQNVPGAFYNTESGFEWQNNSPNGPPSPNPPNGTGTVPVQQGLGAPLHSAALDGLDTGINQVGIANFGTRIAVRFSGVPSGASLQVPAVITFSNSQSAPTGVMVLTTTDSAGAGPFAPQTGTVTVTNNLAVYEVLWADPFSVETAAIPYTVLNGSPASVTATAGFAPFYSDSGSQQASASAPAPRFLDSAELCAEQSCLNVAPSQGANTGPIQVSITYAGTQSLAGAQAVLRAAGMPDIPGAGNSNPASNSLTITFDLTNAPIGARDVVVTPAGQSAITLAGGFSVLGSPNCGYSAAPENSSFPATGGNGSIVVTTTSPSCGWTVGPPVSWITILPVSPALPLVQPFVVAPNSGGPRSGTIFIEPSSLQATAGSVLNVTQAGASSCIYGISPGTILFSTSGGNFTISVTAGAGCSWTATSSAPWVTLPGGSSGLGNGSVTIAAAPNLVGFRSAAVTIGDQTFNVTQNASGCGGTDVSAQVKVTSRAIVSAWGSEGFFEQVELENKGGPIAGPLYLLAYGMCYVGTGPSCPLMGNSGYALAQCPAGNLVPAVLVSQIGLGSGGIGLYAIGLNFNPYQNPVSPIAVGSVTFSVISGVPSLQ